MTDSQRTTISWEMFIKSDAEETRTALAIVEGNHWRELTYTQLKQMVEELSSYLIEQGVNRGEKVAILSESSPE